jgi:hypothetical protein
LTRNNSARRPARRSTTKRQVVATAPAENALTLALDRFLLPRKEEIWRWLAVEARR